MQFKKDNEQKTREKYKKIRAKFYAHFTKNISCVLRAPL